MTRKNEDYFDITANLRSIQFESSLEDDEVIHLPLRNRSHCLLINACAHACFMVRCLNNFRVIRNYVKDPGHKKISTKMLMELNLSDVDALNIGIIGAGRLGKHLADTFLNIARIDPRELRISTRRPETLKHLSEKGVLCTFDNVRVASSVHILFICVLPSQLHLIADELRGQLARGTILYIFAPGLEIPRLRQLFDHESLISSSYLWNDDMAMGWDVSNDVMKSFQKEEIIQQTCPLPVSDTSAEFISCDPKLLSLWVYGMCNYATVGGLSVSQTTDVLNNLFMGIEDLTELQDESTIAIRMDDLVHDLDNNGRFPFFDLCEIATRKTYFDQRLQSSDEFRQTILQNYLRTFAGFFKWNLF